MTIQTFKSTDFDVFTVDGLEERMSAIKTNIHPKLEALGNNLQNTYPNKLMRTFLSCCKTRTPQSQSTKRYLGCFSTNKRGYKMLPHFQIGLWGTHAFIYFGLIYECPQKLRRLMPS